eukprot:scaffold412_cov388-Prasinococcus_capsulatus_cf.AAC.39
MRGAKRAAGVEQRVEGALTSRARGGSPRSRERGNASASALGGWVHQGGAAPCRPPRRGWGQPSKAPRWGCPCGQEG